MNKTFKDYNERNNWLQHNLCELQSDSAELKITHQDTHAKNGQVVYIRYADILKTLTEPTMADNKLQENMCCVLHA